MNQMNEFNQLHDTCSRSLSNAVKYGYQLCVAGVNIVKSTDDVTLKQHIFSKLNNINITLYPDNARLNFYLGNTMKEAFPDAAYYFSKKSYELEPNNLENLIDLCDYYIQRKQNALVLELDKNGLFKRYLSDWRFAAIYYQCIKEESHSASIQYNKQVIAHLTNVGCTNEKEKEILIAAYTHLSNTYCTLCEHDLAVQACEKAIKLVKILKPDNNLLILTTITTYLSLSGYYYLESDKVRQQATLANNYIESSKDYSFRGRTRSSSQKIKIGYVSSDFTNHTVVNFITAILKNHNRDKFDVFLFPNQETISDDIFDYEAPYKNIVGMTDKEAADLVYSMKIDILIDLNGHTVGNRLGIFGLHPAPIQMTYIGYPNTTGLKCFQYRITDGVADPADTIQFFSENLLRLPKCFLLFDNCRQKKPTTPRKTTDKIILGSLNKEDKTNKYVMDTWKTILKECPNTVLLIKLNLVKDPTERIEFYKKQLDVGKERLLVLNHLDDDGYNKLFTMVDIVLDTFPYNGTTTTCLSLYNSVPVVTLSKPNSHVHNVSSSILTNAGLTELITRTETEYIELVKDLVANPDRIDEYKRTVSDKFIESMKVEPFMEDYEAALEMAYNV